MSTLTFEIDSFIAESTVADVCWAHLATGERVVIKRLRSDLRHDPASRLLLIEEGELLRRLSHGNLCRCLATLPEPPTLVLEGLDGGTLEQLLRTSNQGLALGKALTIMREVAQAVVYLHGQGVAHLGVLPSNIMLSTGDRVVLIDLSHGRWPGRKVRIDREPSLSNVGYACPEVWAGEQLGMPADLYRLGALLWHMLVGRSPELCAGAILGNPHPGIIPLCQAVPDVPPPVAKLQAALTAPHPAARPHADEALVREIDELGRCCRGTP